MKSIGWILVWNLPVLVGLYSKKRKATASRSQLVGTRLPDASRLVTTFAGVYFLAWGFSLASLARSEFERLPTSLGLIFLPGFFRSLRSLDQKPTKRLYSMQICIFHEFWQILIKIFKNFSSKSHISLLYKHFSRGAYLRYYFSVQNQFQFLIFLKI